MKHSSMPTKFSGFAWGLAVFCMPVLLWPLALLVSTGFAKNPALTEEQINLFSTLFWIYPFVLAIIARLLYKLRQKHPKLAVHLLGLSAVGFYGTLIYILA
ncbi:DUF5389 family protein [Rodentibacter trehalosifermentans]|uniref:Uncharacterized protein n=2 Tax=Rodentibacter trehalosifermentans TaxID=1908263 RepID=A0A1V3IPE7_9PAST|nr:DUF5389 family protein [Rodentibacter trehalosifermentans]OOF44108.1 hypothetical protein BKK51_10070 [Rodentibacter trehalosifermentans]OOF48152.1 hypothetical protein BKK53_10400 [Rodentibacter trehalosifermentans]